MNPFEYCNAINYTKKDIMVDDTTEKAYSSYMINRQLSYFPDTILAANEMNRNHFVDKDMQFHFLLNSIRSKKRFSPFLRASKLKNIDLVKEYYGYSNEKAKTVLDILTKDQLKLIKEKLYKGGTK